MKAVSVIVLILNANFRHILRMDIYHLLLSSLFLQQWATWKAGKGWVQNSPFMGYKILQSISPHQLRKDKDNDNMSQKPMSRNWEEARVFRRVQSHCWDEEPQGGNGRGQWCRESGRCSCWEQEVKSWLNFRAHHRMPGSQSRRIRQDSPSFLLTQSVASWGYWELASKHHIPVRTQPQMAALTAPSKGEQDAHAMIILYSLGRTVYL